jgi:hypothetical protein
MTFDNALGLVRLMILRGIARDDAIDNPVIPQEYRQQIREILVQEENIILEPARFLVATQQRDEWLRQLDRSTWYYWPRLREYLIGVRNWETPAVRSLDEVTDRILGQLVPPSTHQFDIRGLVLGYVQSGKTANFTALIAKTADVGYRLVIVLSGIDNGLRRQTQIRLNRELVGYADNYPNAVRLPPMGQRWHQFTSEDLNGDFRPGLANYAALQGTQPVLLVIKKNGLVLRRLHTWLDAAPEDIRRTLPVLIVDDEADQASVDTRGTYQSEDEPLPDDYEEPSVINRLIRELLSKFQRRAYVAYTATPFANILIPHDTFDPQVENDLYPKDFIVDLPKPRGYFGAEDLFGRFDQTTGEDIGGLDVVRHIPDADLDLLQQGVFPHSMEVAILDFVLAGTARAQRGQGDAPATMLIHISQRVLIQLGMAERVNQRFSELRDEWRYQRQLGIRDQLRRRWNEEFRPVIRSSHLDRDATFNQIERFIGPFFESVQVRVINSATGEVLDYEREPGLKAIAVGGNRLSRGLTLEGLLLSYFVRRSTMYDTIMQMGRWFGFRNGYEDLTRIYMTPELAGWFSDLAFVEHDLRQDIQVYEAQDLTPLQLSTRIYQHPAMLVTNRAKQRYANRITVEQSYSSTIVQTIRFPFQRPSDLMTLLQANLDSTRLFLNSLNTSTLHWSEQGPVWRNVHPERIIEFLQVYRVDAEVRNISLSLICDYIERQLNLGELQNWTVAVKGLESLDRNLGEIDLGVPNGSIYSISRTRLASDPDSIGTLRSPRDEEEGLSSEQLDRARALHESDHIDIAGAARMVRPATEGLLLLYPISRYSGQSSDLRSSRRPLYEDPSDPGSLDVIGLAISFPSSDRAPRVFGEYLVGTVGWRPV